MPQCNLEMLKTDGSVPTMNLFKQVDDTSVVNFELSIKKCFCRSEPRVGGRCMPKTRMTSSCCRERSVSCYISICIFLSILICICICICIAICICICISMMAPGGGWADPDDWGGGGEAASWTWKRRSQCTRETNVSWLIVLMIRLKGYM